jgi:formiminotetrahydrofolate cyclodeaminase
MKLTELTVTELLAAFQSSNPTPGGGSASALAGAVGASLLTMVAALPKPRAETEEDRERLAEAGRLCATLAKDLTALVDRDSEAYEAVMAAYRLPKNSDTEKTARSQAIQEGLRQATATPLDVMRACAAAIEQAVVVARHGNASASSDVQVAVELLRAGVVGARANVEINLKSLKVAGYVQSTREEAEWFEQLVDREASRVRNLLGNSLRDQI